MITAIYNGEPWQFDKAKVKTVNISADRDATMKVEVEDGNDVVEFHGIMHIQVQFIGELVHLTME